MGNNFTTKADKGGCWKPKQGCEHFTDDTLIIKQKWKTVPMTQEEAKKVYKRMLSITSRVAVEGTHSFSVKQPKELHECVEVSQSKKHYPYSSA